MLGAGISSGDELLVDRSKHPRDGDVVVATLDSELTIKRLQITGAGVSQEKLRAAIIEFGVTLREPTKSKNL